MPRSCSARVSPTPSSWARSSRDILPGLSQASRTVGSPQIRNAGTLGGNLGTASPAGDTLPVLAALDATIVVASRHGRRSLSLDELIVGPKRTTLGPGEVIVEVRVPAGMGSQEFLKVGTRNAMVIAVANVAVVVDWLGRSVRCALGSVGPVMIRAGEAEEFISLTHRLGEAEPRRRSDRRSRVCDLGTGGGAADRRSPLHGRLPQARCRRVRTTGDRAHICETTPRRRWRT